MAADASLSPRPEEPPAPPAPRRSGRWTRRLAVLGALLLVAGLAHPLVLRALGRVLVVDQPCEAPSHVLLIGGDSAHDRAAELLRDDPRRRVLLIPWRPGRLTRVGLLPPAHQIARRALLERDVPAEAIHVLQGQARSQWQAARLLDDYLAAHPRAEVVVLCDRFASRRHRLVLDRVLDPRRAQRMSVRGLRDRRYDETDWWRVRRGAKEFLTAGIVLTHAWLAGETPPAPEWDPDEYERELVSR